MKIKELYEEWDRKKPTNGLKLDLWHPTEANMMRQFSQIEKKKSVTHYEAAMIPGSYPDIVDHVADYKLNNTVFQTDIMNRIVSVLKRVIPVDKTFFRGSDGDKQHPMPFQSWTPAIDIARMFADSGALYKTIEPVKGVEINNVFYWYGLIHNDVISYGDAQAEWFLLTPKRTKI